MYEPNFFVKLGLPLKLLILCHPRYDSHTYNFSLQTWPNNSLFLILFVRPPSEQIPLLLHHLSSLGLLMILLLLGLEFFNSFIWILSLPQFLHVKRHIRDERGRIGLARSIYEARRLIFTIVDVWNWAYTVVVSIICEVIVRNLLFRFSERAL